MTTKSTWVTKVREQPNGWDIESDAKKRAAAAAAKDETARRIAALPDVMQQRLQKFRDTNPDFDWEYLPYELMVCEDAVKIADALRPRATTAVGWISELSAFHDLGWGQQKLIVPNLDTGHSGNSFGMACRLARWLLTDPEIVVKDHGALTPLVGCEAYGCPHDAPAVQEAE